MYFAAVELLKDYGVNVINSALKCLKTAYQRFIFLNWKKHDGVFSLKNHTPVLIYIKSANEMFVDGESKHISLLKSFDIYPQAYLGTCDSDKCLNDVWSTYCNLKEIFDNSKIDEVLLKNRTAYLNFLETTKL